MVYEDATNTFGDSESKYSSKFFSIYNDISTVLVHEKVEVIWHVLAMVVLSRKCDHRQKLNFLFFCAGIEFP